MSSNYVDTTAIMQVIGCVFNNPTLLDITDKYIIVEEDFVEDFHKILFGSIYNLSQKTNVVTIDSILDYLSVRPKHLATFENNKGVEYLTKVSQLAEQGTFNYYYSRLKKFTLLRAYDNIGLDVSDLYNPDEILDVNKKQKQEDWLDLTSLEDIATTIDLKIDEIRIKYVDEAKGDGWQAGEGLKDLILSLEENPEIGVPLYGRLINTATRGARLKKFYLRSAPSGVGKAIPNNTILFTPDGFKRVDEVKIGDKLFGDDGKPTTVLNIFPQKEKKQVYEITFSDGRKAKCCKDHLWEYYYQSHRNWQSRVESLDQIIKRTEKLKNGLKTSDNNGYRFKIKLNQPVIFPEKELPLNPYVLGLLLGDGSFRYQDSQKDLTFSSNDEELPNTIGKICDWEVQKNSDFNYNYSFKYKDNLYSHKKVWVEDVIVKELWNKKSQDKFIPEDYLTSSIEQRYQLLQGLLDTDGTIDEKGRVSFENTSKKLIKQVEFICRSLGFITSISEDKRKEKYTESCYKLRIQCKKQLKPKLFNLKRKKEKAEKYAASNKREEYKEFLSIVNIEKLNDYTDMTCFTVDNQSHLFLMNDFIVTHNTRTMIADACYLACDEIYDENFGWIKNGISQPTLYITTEQELSEIQTMMLAFISNVDEEHILNGQYIGDERERVLYAADVISRASLWVEELPDFSLQDIENKIKKNIRDHDIKYLFNRKIETMKNFSINQWGKQLIAC